jgi:hypothetical protein
VNGPFWIGVAVGWLLAGIPVGWVVGGVIRERDRQESTEGTEG